MKVKQQLMELFQKYDDPIREIIIDVIRVEQENITEPNPRITPHIKREIDTAVSRQAKVVLKDEDAGNQSTSPSQ